MILDIVLKRVCESSSVVKKKESIFILRVNGFYVSGDV